MREPENILMVDTLNPDFLGIIFHANSPRNMNNNPDAIPETKAQKVGVFVDTNMETIIKKAREFNLSTIQLHGNESPETCTDLINLGYSVFKAFKIDDKTQASEIEPYKGKCTAFIFDTKTEKHGGSGKKFNWNKLDELALIDKFFLSGGINANDAKAILKLNYENLIGLDLNSKFEIKPGLKDVNMLQTFINGLQKQPINIV